MLLEDFTVAQGIDFCGCFYYSPSLQEQQGVVFVGDFFGVYPVSNEITPKASPLIVKFMEEFFFISGFHWLGPSLTGVDI
jgi:hypothetical protein